MVELIFSIRQSAYATNSKVAETTEKWRRKWKKRGRKKTYATVYQNEMYIMAMWKSLPLSLCMHIIFWHAKRLRGPWKSWKRLLAYVSYIVSDSRQTKYLICKAIKAIEKYAVQRTPCVWERKGERDRERKSVCMGKSAMMPEIRTKCRLYFGYFI